MKFLLHVVLRPTSVDKVYNSALQTFRCQKPYKIVVILPVTCGKNTTQIDELRWEKTLLAERVFWPKFFSLKLLEVSWWYVVSAFVQGLTLIGWEDFKGTVPPKKLPKYNFFASIEVSTCSGCYGISQLCDVCKVGLGKVERHSYPSIFKKCLQKNLSPEKFDFCNF